MPAHYKTCLKQLSELTSLCYDPATRFFHARPALLKLTAALPITDRHLFKSARRSRGGRSGSCSRRIGLRGNNDRGHNTHNAYLETRTKRG
jgi:hypothetical protein